MEMLMENADEHLVSLGGVSSAGSGKDSKHFTKAIEVIQTQSLQRRG